MGLERESGEVMWPRFENSKTKRVPAVIFSNGDGYKRVKWGSGPTGAEIRQEIKLHFESEECCVEGCERLLQRRITLKVLWGADSEPYSETFDHCCDTTDEWVDIHIGVCNSCVKTMEHKVLIKDNSFALSDFYYEFLDCKVCGSTIVLLDDLLSSRCTQNEHFVDEADLV